MSNGSNNDRRNGNSEQRERNPVATWAHRNLTVFGFLTAGLGMLISALLGVFVEDRIGQIAENEEVNSRQDIELSDIKRLLPQLLELQEAVAKFSQGVDRVNGIEYRVDQLRQEIDKYEQVQRLIGVRIDNFGVKQSGMMQELKLFDERLDTLERVKRQ